MANRYDDWLRQGTADVQHARDARSSGSCEWACFAAQQGAEKAVKGVFLFRGMEAWGHTVAGLLGRLAEDLEVPEELITAAKALDKHYIPARYPNGLPDGAPVDSYTDEEAARAIQQAEAIVDFCRRQAV